MRLSSNGQISTDPAENAGVRNVVKLTALSNHPLALEAKAQS